MMVVGVVGGNKLGEQVPCATPTNFVMCSTNQLTSTSSCCHNEYFLILSKSFRQESHSIK